MSGVFTVLGVRVHMLNMRQTLAEIEKSIRSAEKMIIVTANTEIVMLCQKDTFFRDIVNTAQLTLPDGIGVVWAGKYLGHDVKRRVTGFDLTQDTIALAAEKGFRVYFFGAAPGVAAKAASKAHEQYPALKIAGWRDGFFSPHENNAIIKEINNTAPDILLAALGAPKQEKWLYTNKNSLNCKIFLGVGGTFDIMAGLGKRAPKFLQDMGLEWLYRLCRQPSRLMRVLSIPHFMYKVLLSKKH